MKCFICEKEVDLGDIKECRHLNEGVCYTCCGEYDYKQCSFEVTQCKPKPKLIEERVEDLEFLVERLYSLLMPGCSTQVCSSIQKKGKNK